MDYSANGGRSRSRELQRYHDGLRLAWLNAPSSWSKTPLSHCSMRRSEETGTDLFSDRADVWWLWQKNRSASASGERCFEALADAPGACEFGLGGCWDFESDWAEEDPAGAVSHCLNWIMCRHVKAVTVKVTAAPLLLPERRWRFLVTTSSVTLLVTQGYTAAARAGPGLGLISGVNNALPMPNQVSQAPRSRRHGKTTRVPSQPPPEVPLDGPQL